MEGGFEDFVSLIDFGSSSFSFSTSSSGCCCFFSLAFCFRFERGCSAGVDRGLLAFVFVFVAVTVAVAVAGGGALEMKKIHVQCIAFSFGIDEMIGVKTKKTYVVDGFSTFPLVFCSCCLVLLCFSFFFLFFFDVDS